MNEPCRLFALVFFAVAASLSGPGCSGDADPSTSGEELARSQSPYTTSDTVVGDWADLPGNAQCVVGVRVFYENKLGVALPWTQDTWANAVPYNCAPAGACHYWIDSIFDANAFEQITSGSPQTYDVIVYPATATDAYGHVALVDHVENGQIFVMDNNYKGDGKPSAKPHTVDWAPNGWYHLKAGYAASSGSGNSSSASSSSSSSSSGGGTSSGSGGGSSSGGDEVSCGQLAGQMGFGQAQCEWNGNGACGGQGTATVDCDHCCDAGGSGATSGGGGNDGLSCGQLAAQMSFGQAACEWNGNGACGGQGAKTVDCDHCCDVSAF